MCAKLVAYEYVPSGFEMVIEKKEVKAWNLWWNVKLTDDPAIWDDEIKAINKLQDGLVELSENQRLIRAQMAQFCRLNPYFPQSIDVLCEEIGDRCFSKPIRIGCEGRGLLNSLGYNDPQSLNDQRKEMFTEYLRSFEKWLVQSLPETLTDSKISGFLGQPTEAKEVFVKNLISVIDLENPSIDSLKKLVENECVEAQRKSEILAFRPFNCLKCNGSISPIPNCECCYSMFIDAGLLCTGTFDEKRYMSDEFRRFIEENILTYSDAINSWLKEETQKAITSPITPRYVTKYNALKIAERVHSSLGEKDEAKEWLAACLLKTIKDNQRWHKRIELIDNFSETTSWLEEML